MCPICRTADSRLLCNVPTAGHAGRSLLTVRTITPPLHQCPDVGIGEDGRASMVFFGELDSYTSSMIQAGCLDWLSTAGDAVIDLSALTLVDSAGTRLLERLRAQAPGDVRFRDPSRIVRNVFAAIGRPMEAVSDDA